jgi:4-hydroxy-tetrahydrodipicolinate synthase
MDAALFGALAGSVAGIKDTTCTLEGIRAKQQVAGDAVVYQANTPFLVDALASGVRGIMAIISTVRPDWVLQLWHGFHAGEDVRALHRRLVILDTMLELGYPASAKHLTVRRGLPITTHTRAPVKLRPEAARALDVWFDGA